MTLYTKRSTKMSEGTIAVEPEHVTSLTPNGIEVFYSWAPRRYYKLCYRGGNRPPFEEEGVWVEVPSVTKVLDVLDKSGALTWWGMKVGVKGVLRLVEQNKLDVLAGHECVYLTDAVIAFLTQEKLTVNHVKDKAADRGTNIHKAFEAWAVDPSFRPDPNVYPENEQGYIRGLNSFLGDLGPVDDIQAEVMVGSVEHGFAGRYDLRLNLGEAVMVVKTFPKRKPQHDLIAPGKYLLDLKTSKSVYDSHALQLAAYEMASVECGYGPTDYRAVVHVTEDGRYELVRTHAAPEDFLSILQAHQTMQRSKEWM